jgi:hypothetical protein
MATHTETSVLQVYQRFPQAAMSATDVARHLSDLSPQGIKNIQGICISNDA